jgi:hypothetical protein
VAWYASQPTGIEESGTTSHNSLKDAHGKKSEGFFLILKKLPDYCSRADCQDVRD